MVTAKQPNMDNSNWNQGHFWGIDSGSVVGASAQCFNLHLNLPDSTASNVVRAGTCMYQPQQPWTYTCTSCLCTNIDPVSPPQSFLWKTLNSLFSITAPCCSLCIHVLFSTKSNYRKDSFKESIIHFFYCTVWKT